MRLWLPRALTIALFIILAALGDAYAQTPVIRNEGGGGIINIGQAFGWLEPYINSAVGAVIALIVSWVLYLTKLDRVAAIDAKYRDAFETFLKNQAATLVAKGFVSLKDSRIEVNSEALLAAAELAFQYIPDTLKWFGIDKPNILVEKIIAKLPQVPAIATAQAAALAPTDAIIAATPPADPA